MEESFSLASWQLSLGVEDLSAARFAISPLYESLQALGALRGWGVPGPLDSWRRWVTGQHVDDALHTPLIDGLVFSGRPTYPEFLTPSPGSLWTTIEDELETVRAVRPESIASSVARVWPPGTLTPAAESLLARPPEVLSRVADELLQVYDLLVRPHWSRVRPVLEADVGFKARLIARGGFGTLFAHLHRAAVWDGTTLRVGATEGRQAEVADGGLILTPSVFGPPYPTVKFHTSSRTALRYPARGVGAVFLESSQASPGVNRLIGVGRARVLGLLVSPRTPTSIAAELGITPSAASQHLRVLREAGLVLQERVGRSVVYGLSEVGAALLGLAGSATQPTSAPDGREPAPR